MINKREMTHPKVKEFSKRENILVNELEQKELDVQEHESYLNIWKVIPSLRDIKLKYEIIRITFLLGVHIILGLFLYIITDNILITAFIPIISVIAFIFVFFLSPFQLFSKGKIEPFGNLRFWQLSGEKENQHAYKRKNDILYISNRRDLMHAGIVLYKITVIPENIHPNLVHFLKALYNERVPFTYQVVQAPLMYKSSETLNIEVYFALSHYVSGILTTSKTKRINDNLQEIMEAFEKVVVQDFPHFKFEQLTGEDLLNEFKTFLFNIKVPERERKTDTEDSYNKSLDLKSKVIKPVFVALIIIYVDIFIWFFVEYGLFWIPLVNILTLLAIFMFLWREGLFFLSKFIFLRGKDKSVKPFRTLSFYRFREQKKTLFIHINKKILVGLRFFNVKYATPPQFLENNIFISSSDKFFRGLVNTSFPFSYTIVASPVSYAYFENKVGKLTTDRVQERLNDKLMLFDQENWMNMRCGMWRVMQIYSVQNYSYSTDITEALLKNQALELKKEVKSFLKLVEGDFTNYKVESMTSRDGIFSSVKTVMLKSKFFRYAGTHLKYLMLQGKTLENLMVIATEFKKGIETRIAAEFNTPINIKNLITIGKTINTEHLEGEQPAGFTSAQVKKLVVANGGVYDRQNMLFIIATELVKEEIPSIIFDYYGLFSKVIKYFEGTQFENDFLHFKLGKNFQLDPFNTDIPYDKTRGLYIDLILDMFGMIYKKSKKAMVELAAQIKEEDFALQDLVMEKETQNRWERDYSLDATFADLNFLTENPSVLINKKTGSQDVIAPYTFIQNRKTIIIDLSIFNDLESKVFIAYLIIIKIHYYLLKSIIEPDLTKHMKTIIIPNLDLVFRNNFLEVDNDYDYSKINKFIGSLYELDLSLISTVDQVRNLHPTVFKYLENIITFRATDTRDIAALKNLLNLQELHGTGYYSPKRQESYQLEFLKNMKHSELIVRRQDFNQPFPVMIDPTILGISEDISKEELNSYMKQQGFNTEEAENMILSDSKKSLFEQHFGPYYPFLEELMTFFSILNRLEDIGNLYRAKIKEELLKIIEPKAQMKLGNDNQRINHLRDKLFEIMLKYGYLVEAHPRRASNSQSIRPSYVIGPQYQASLNDYYEVNKESPTDISFDVVSKESDETEKFEELFANDQADSLLEGLNTPPESKTVTKEKIEETLINHCGQFIAKVVGIYGLIEREELTEALHLQESALEDFIRELYIEIYPDKEDQNPRKIIEDATDFFVNFASPVITYKYLNALKLESYDEDDSEEYKKQILRGNLDTLVKLSHSIRKVAEEI